MKKLITSIAGMALLLLVGCATQPIQPIQPTTMFYQKSSLNYLALGQTKEKTLSMFPAQRSSLKVVPGMEIRAAQRSSSGKLLEVGEVLLTDGVTSTISYWFMFEDGLLVQWGRPEDWNKAAARYDINFNPSPGVLPK